MYLSKVELEAVETELPVVRVGLVLPLSEHGGVVELERLRERNLSLKQKGLLEAKHTWLIFLPS